MLYAAIFILPLLGCNLLLSSDHETDTRIAVSRPNVVTARPSINSGKIPPIVFIRVPWSSRVTAGNEGQQRTVATMPVNTNGNTRK